MAGTADHVDLDEVDLDDVSTFNKLHGYPVHPAAEVFPLLKGNDLQELANDIRAHGLTNSIVLLNGAVLDGRNRLVACHLAGVKPSFTHLRVSDPNFSPMAYSLSQNALRRQLTQSQKAALAEDIRPLYELEARKRALEGARRGGLATAAKRAQAPAPMFSGTEPEPLTKAPRSGNAAVTEHPFQSEEPVVVVEKQEFTARARDQAAKAAGVSAGYASKAKRVKERNPELFNKLRSGEVTMSQAARTVGITSTKSIGEKRREEEAANAPKRRTISKPKNGKVESSRVTLTITATFGSEQAAQDLLFAMESDKRCLSMDHETVDEPVKKSLRPRRKFTASV